MGTTQHDKALIIENEFHGNNRENSQNTLVSTKKETNVKNNNEQSNSIK